MLILFIMLTVVGALRNGYYYSLKSKSLNYTTFIYKDYINNIDFEELAKYNMSKKKKLPGYTIPNWVYKKVFSNNLHHYYD